MIDDLTPSEIGARAEAAVAKALAEAGKTVLFAIHGAHLRYDLVFEDADGFHRVQCKSGRLLDDVVFFRAHSNTNNIPKGYQGEVDLFGVYCRALDEVYFVPIEAVATRTTMTLRLAPPRNSQQKRIHWASDYRIVSEAPARYDAGVDQPEAPALIGRRGPSGCLRPAPQPRRSRGRVQRRRSLHRAQAPRRARRR